MDNKKHNRLAVWVLALDDIAALVLVFAILWFLGIEIPLAATIVIGLVGGTAIFFIHRAIVAALHRKKTTGAEGMIGLRGKVIEPLRPAGVIKVGGEYWTAKATGTNIGPGEEVEVMAVNGLVLTVKASNDRPAEGGPK